mmetsp:Transcript_52680/g.136438  ORF Transcript_52680/g.136438 Transcript_52680/m.136438 type:complete len:232 (+) Transcript_52680:278-973(+)
MSSPKRTSKPPVLLPPTTCQKPSFSPTHDTGCVLLRIGVAAPVTEISVESVAHPFLCDGSSSASRALASALAVCAAARSRSTTLMFFWISSSPANFSSSSCSRLETPAKLPSYPYFGRTFACTPIARRCRCLRNSGVDAACLASSNFNVSWKLLLLNRSINSFWSATARSFVKGTGTWARSISTPGPPACGPAASTSASARPFDPSQRSCMSPTVLMCSARAAAAAAAASW